MGLGNQASYRCSDEKTSVAETSDIDIDAFIAVADEFRRRVGILDQQAIQIKRVKLLKLSDEMRLRLARLQQQKEEIVAELIRSFPRRLSSRGADKVRLHVSERVKNGIKMSRPNGHVESNSAEYSDSYTIDNSGQTYDPSTDTVYVPDSAPPSQMVGIGVSEDNYTSGATSTSTYTIISSPDGQSISGWSQGYTHSVAEAISLTLDPQTAAEGEYTVNSEHTYYLPSYQERIEAFDPNASSPEKMIQRYSSFVSLVRKVWLAYQYSGNQLGCNDPNKPWAYLSYCANANAYAPCNRARVCASWVATFTQGVGLRITYPGLIVRVTVCGMYYYPYPHSNPWCSP